MEINYQCWPLNRANEDVRSPDWWRGWVGGAGEAEGQRGVMGALSHKRLGAHAPSGDPGRCPLGAEAPRNQSLAQAVAGAEETGG